MKKKFSSVILRVMPFWTAVALPMLWENPGEIRFWTLYQGNSERKITREKGETVFRFGGNHKYKSTEKITFPCSLAEKTVLITADVVDTDIPLLLSKPFMKSVGGIMNLQNDTIEFFGVTLPMETTKSGHYCVPLSNHEVTIAEVQFSAAEMSKLKLLKTIRKLHRQFAYPTAANLRILLQNSGVFDDRMADCLAEVMRQCRVYHVIRKTPSRPVVALPRATEFNDLVAMDLKYWSENVYFLHLIDVFTRFSLATIVTSKKPEMIVHSVVKMWLGTGLRSPRKFLVDNDEFANKVYLNLAENFNVEVVHTAAESPWQNGICERIHVTVDACVSKLLEDDSSLPLDDALAWAVNAKNAMQNYLGYTPYQLVFGRLPNLPGMLNDK